MRQLSLCFLIAAVALAGNAQIPNSQPRYVDIPSVTFTPAAQQQDEWCWAASIQMILNYYRIPVTQQMIVARVKGALIDQGGSDEDISQSLNGWAPGTDGQVRIIRSVTTTGAPVPETLVAELSHGHPILLTFATGPYSGHAVVITAASYVPWTTGPVVLSLVFRDPWPSPSNLQTNGRVELQGPALMNFLQLVRSYWLVTVTSGSSSPVSSSGPSRPQKETNGPIIVNNP